MDRIYAGGNVRIEVQPDSWVLLVNTDQGDNVLAEAVQGQPIRYVSVFGSQRKLPIGGQLQTTDVERVVLGWSPKDEAWHLGLMLSPALSQARGSRWCELAHWPDPNGDQYHDLARQASVALAERIVRPFSLIPRSDNGAASPAAPTAPGGRAAPAYDPRRTQEGYTAVRETPPPQLEPLPLRFDLWTLNARSQGRANGTSYPSGALEFRLSGSWGRSKVLRAGWYFFWAAVFVVLSVQTLVSPIAQPRPEFLPYLGLACAVLLLLLFFANFIRAGRRLNRIVIDPAQRVISGGRGRRVGVDGRGRWSYSSADIEGVYVSHSVTKVNRRRKREPMRAVQYGELNLLLRGGRFVHLLSHGALDDKFRTLEPLPPEDEDDLANEDAVTLLTAYDVQTPLQAAGMYAANALNVPCYYDKRVR
jgi:hypothetical protein